jgi:hypothetical protein
MCAKVIQQIGEKVMQEGGLHQGREEIALRTTNCTFEKETDAWCTFVPTVWAPFRQRACS